MQSVIIAEETEGCWISGVLLSELTGTLHAIGFCNLGKVEGYFKYHFLKVW